MICGKLGLAAAICPERPSLGTGGIGRHSELDGLHPRRRAAVAVPTEMSAHNFKVGHHDLGRTEMNGDVWVHGNFVCLKIGTIHR